MRLHRAELRPSYEEIREVDPEVDVPGTLRVRWKATSPAPLPTARLSALSHVTRDDWRGSRLHRRVVGSAPTGPTEEWSA